VTKPSQALWKKSASELLADFLKKFWSRFSGWDTVTGTSQCRQLTQAAGTQRTTGGSGGHSVFKMVLWGSWLECTTYASGSDCDAPRSRDHLDRKHHLTASKIGHIFDLLIRNEQKSCSLFDRRAGSEAFTSAAACRRERQYDRKRTRFCTTVQDIPSLGSRIL
jgi:hypothetical protein